MKTAIPTLLFLLFIAITQAQVGVGTTDPNASLDIRSTNQANPTNTDGILIPKIDEFPTTNPTFFQDGMMVYVTGNGSEPKGFYYWDNVLSSWVEVNGARQLNDLVDARSDISSIFIGEDSGLSDNGTDNQNIGLGFASLNAIFSGNRNLAIGYSALHSATNASFNIAIGNQALFNNNNNYNTAIGLFTLFNNTTGSSNKALGTSALYNNISGSNNLAFGGSALFDNVDGNANMAFGTLALGDNISGSYNTAFGQGALRLSTGSGNVALGNQAGFSETGSNTLYIENTNANADNALIYGEFGPNSSSSGNILRTNSEFQIGNPVNTGYAFPTVDGTMHQVLQTNGNGDLLWVDGSSIGVQRINDLIDGKSDSNGSSIFLGIDSGLNDDNTNNLNVGIGYMSMINNLDGANNTALGAGSLQSNINGNQNTALGVSSLFNNTSGDGNTAVGFNTLALNSNGTGNTAVGRFTLANNLSGIRNTANGGFAMSLNSTGNWNTVYGYEALRTNTNGNANVAIGYQSGYNETGSNKLYIENSDSVTPLIYGEFDNDILGLNGDVAIGHQAPNAKLHVLEEGTSGVQTIVGILESDTSNRPTLLFSEAANPDINDGMSIEYNGTGAGSANRLVLNAIGGAPLFEFRNGGSLTLTQGDLILANDGASDREIIFQDNAGNNDRVLIRQNTTDDIYFGDLDDNNGNVIVRAGGVDEMIVEDGGQVGINTMTPNYDLEVNGDAAKPGGGTWIASSDRRLKQHIKSYQRGLEDILKIHPVAFNYNSKSGFDEKKTHVGVIAQDLLQHIPEMVLTTDSSEAYLAVDNSAMTYMLINAIKEQQAQIEQLKEELKHIKSLIKTD